MAEPAEVPWPRAASGLLREDATTLADLAARADRLPPAHWRALAEAVVATVDRPGDAFVGWACSSGGQRCIDSWDATLGPLLDALAERLAGRELQRPVTDLHLDEAARPRLAGPLAAALARLPASSKGPLLDAALDQLATQDPDALTDTRIPVARRVGMTLARLAGGLPLGRLVTDGDALAAALVRQCPPEQFRRLLAAVGRDEAARVVVAAAHAIEPTSYAVALVHEVSARLRPWQRIGFQADVVTADGRLAGYLDDTALREHVAWCLESPDHVPDLAAVDRLVANRGASRTVARWRSVRSPGIDAAWSPDAEIGEQAAAFVFDLSTCDAVDAEAWYDALAELAGSGADNDRLLRAALFSGARGALRADTADVAETALKVVCTDLLPLASPRGRALPSSRKPTPDEARWARIIMDRIRADGDAGVIDQCARSNRSAARLVRAARAVVGRRLIVG